MEVKKWLEGGMIIKQDVQNFGLSQFMVYAPS